MKKEITAAVLLIIFIAFTLINSVCVSEKGNTVTGLAEQAMLCAASGDWESASDNAHKALSVWEGFEDYAMTVALHSDIEDIKRELLALSGYAEEKDAEMVSSSLLSVKAMISHFIDSEKLTLGNILFLV